MGSLGGCSQRRYYPLLELQQRHSPWFLRLLSCGDLLILGGAMNLFETASEAKYRLQTHLDELGLPAKFVDEIIGHHTVANYNKGSMVSLQVSLVRAISSVTLIISIQKVAGPRFSRLKH